MSTETTTEKIGAEAADNPAGHVHVHGPGCNHGHHHGAQMAPYVRASAKVGVNEPCPCGSGKKYKKCCR